MTSSSSHQQREGREAAERPAASRRNYARREVLRLSVVAPLSAALLAACGGAATTTVATTAAGTTASLSTAAATTASLSTAPVTTAPASTSLATTAPVSAAATTASAASRASAAATTGSAAPVSSAVSAPSTGASTISWFADDPGAAGLAVFQGIFTQFEKENPKFKVQLTNSDNTKFATSIAGGVYPDVQDTETRELPGLIYKQADVDITSYVQKAKLNQADFSASQIAKVIFNGKWYGIPWDTSPTAIFYNKTLFRNAGVTEPPKKWGDPGWTWDTFLQTAKRLTTGSGATASFGWDYNVYWPFFFPWVWANGGEFSNKDRTQITITDSAYSDAYQWRADITNVQHAAPTAAQAKQATWNNGKIAMMAADPYNTVGMDQALHSTDWDIAPYPAGKAGAFPRSPADCCCLVNHAPNPDGGMAAILYFVGATSQKTLARAGYTPVLNAALQSADFLQPSGHVTRQVFADGLAFSQPTPIPFIYPDVNPLFTKALPDLMAGTITAKDMMIKLQPPVQALLDKAPPAWRILD